MNKLSIASIYVTIFWAIVFGFGYAMYLCIAKLSIPQNEVAQAAYEKGIKDARAEIAGKLLVCPEVMEKQE